MEKSLRILHLEDSPFDAQLVAATLEQDGIACQLLRVDTRDEFIGALAKGCFDLILADCTLPTFDGIEALEITQRMCPETPFIFVSGWLGEEVAIEMLKNGATDYVLKNRMARLCPSVRRALNEVAEKKDRRRAEEELQSSQRFIQQIADASPNILYLYDVINERTVYLNHSVRKIIGYTIEEIQAFGSLFQAALLHPDDQKKVAQQVKQLATIKEDEIREIEYRLKCPDNKWRWLHSSNTLFAKTPEGLPHLILGTAQDLTEDKHLKEQLHHAQKMDSIGTLAGGVAHDFNNLLTAIIGNAQLALAHLSDTELLRERLAEIEKAGQRAGELTRQLLVFSRRQMIERQHIDINDTIENFVKMLRRIIGEDIELQFLPDPKLPAVLVDQGQLEQVILNLAVNARDAMEGGGQFIIETHLVLLDESYGRDHAFVVPGRYAQIVVSDTGSGMDTETQQRIFEPFYTTKDTGKGTGLGLSMVYGIVKQHEGFIQVYSEIGHGTTFKIYLPLSSAAIEETLQEAQPALRGGSETILVVEDEDGLRHLATQILSELGYRVVTANNGKQALEVYKARKDELNLVILDLILPQMGGREVYRQIRETGGQIPVLFMTGYSTEIFQNNFVDDKDAMLIQKPYSVVTLGQQVRQALDKFGSALPDQSIGQ